MVIVVYQYRFADIFIGNGVVMPVIWQLDGIVALNGDAFALFK